MFTMYANINFCSRKLIQVKYFNPFTINTENTASGES